MSFFRRFRKTDDAVIVDSVTGTFNRRQLDRDISTGLVSDQPTSTLMIDVDDFAQYTGKKGAADPDQVLERVAWVIMATVRTTDVVYRHARSSFCVLLPSTNDTDAVTVADRIRVNVEKMPLLSSLSVTISIGVASGPSDDVAGAVDRAIEALGRAMQTGAGSLSSGAPSPEASDELAALAPANRPFTAPVAEPFAAASSVATMPPPAVSTGVSLPPPPGS
ncbi:MAG: GGDEF domain-containing protein [Actinomycetota bacterium]